jgi:hypothetical protein
VAPVFIPESPVVYDFENTASNWKIDTLNSKNLLPGTANRILRFSGSKLAGSYSYRLLYGFKSSDAYVVVKPPEFYFTLKKGHYLGMYLWGDLSENRLSVLLERDGVVTEIPFTEIGFAGWQFREVKIELTGNGEYEFAGFKLYSAGTPFSGSGAIYFDNIVRSEVSMTGTRFKFPQPSEQLTVYPNPARGKVYVEAESISCDSPYRITDISGRSCMEGYALFDGNRAIISISGLTPGTYLITIGTCEGLKNGILIVN